MAKRNPRKKLVKKVDLTKPLIPFDITKFGTDDDPCFGKLFDLTEEACRMCGDQTLCQIKQNQITEGDRLKLEKDNRFKDLELVDDDIRDYAKTKIEAGVNTIRLKKLITKKFGIEPTKARQIIKSIKKK